MIFARIACRLVKCRLTELKWDHLITAFSYLYIIKKSKQIVKGETPMLFYPSSLRNSVKCVVYVIDIILRIAMQ